jgi:4-hydroxy-tetrahydrodipicolinate synthase
LFTGVGVALLSLFDDQKRLLVSDTAWHAARLVDEGVRAVVLAGTTGESWFLTADERKRLIEATRAVVGTEIPLIVGTGHPDEQEAVALTAAMQDTGADGVIVLSPPGLDDPSRYYEAVAEAAGSLPVLAYHFPRVSSPGIALELLDQLPISGIKDSSGDAERLVGEIDACRGNVYTGNPLLLAAAGAFGASGAILGLANLEVAKCAAAFAGDLDAQRDLVGLHLRAKSDFPLSLKQMVAERRGIPTTVRRGSQDMAGATR